LDFGNSDKDDDGDWDKAELTIAEMMEYRFVRAEREKEEVCALLSPFFRLELMLLDREMLRLESASL
jgi:hypothetical protein